MGDDMIQKAKCPKCKQVYRCDKKMGTTNLLRHHNECYNGGLESPRSSTLSSRFSHEKFSEMVVDAMVQHDLPFNFVEYKGIQELLQYISPTLKLPCRNTAKAHVLKLYETEKTKLHGVLGVMQGRICLTSDLWTSQTTDGYLTLTAHWVDSEWKLQKRIISFCRFPPPHHGIALAENINSLICEWEIERNLFSITLDNASANDLFVNKLRTQLNFRGLLVLQGQLFHVRCCAHILNLIVQDGLKSIELSVVKIRECLKYIKGSMARKVRFMSCVEHVGMGGSKKALRQDVPTRWNFTYLMLESAIFYKRALIHFELVDTEFKWCPSEEEWVKVQHISKFLGLFYEVTRLFSGSSYPTSNLFFPKVLMIQQSIKDAMNHYDPFMKQMGNVMNRKFDKYWSDYSLVLGLCVVLDPHFKLALVEWGYKNLYREECDDKLKTFVDTLTSLFNAYVEKYSPEDPSGTNASSQNECEDEFFQDFYATYRSGLTTSNAKTELQMYLDEPRLDKRSQEFFQIGLDDDKKEFDILAWWKLEQLRYPVLGNMARDMLTIPVSTVASESAFSVAGRILDQTRSSLSPKTIEALICYRDWMGGKKDEQRIDWEKLGENVLDLTV